MPEQQIPAAITVTQMAEMIGLSRSRLYSLIDRGLVPRPVMTDSTKRPVYVQELISQVLETRRTGVGANGTLVTFNRKRKKRAVVRANRRTAITPARDADQTEIITGLQSLGLDVTGSQVAALVAEHFPNSANTDTGEMIRQLFLALKRQE
ncbi:hypothetical protein CA51_21120 [Rosistilla oblonga]|uniref:helix-turn-helix transcriptional regulator n=1 Tax=Rosistilla oblonga TaxID=2527990 RepID=UPI00118B5F8F|nr:helix-turn-helix domain-containing protein [Rosistilla oblonga]QDV12231.1 hypothetical protein CA51_21120 [Rosistilla oblonga]